MEWRLFLGFRVQTDENNRVTALLVVWSILSIDILLFTNASGVAGFYMRGIRPFDSQVPAELLQNLHMYLLLLASDCTLIIFSLLFTMLCFYFVFRLTSTIIGPQNTFLSGFLLAFSQHREALYYV